MGLPALRIEPRDGRASRPSLRLVSTASSRPARAARSPRARAAASRQLYYAFVAAVVAIAVLGIGRVWLSTQAAEASRDSSDLRAEIKAERYRGDLLEVRQSALGSPSRIRAIAGSAFGMAQAKEVTYLDLKPDATAPNTQQAKSDALDGLVASAMGLAAGEAQVLLVGDVGLASSQ